MEKIKRFEVADKESRERVRKLLEVFRELRQEFPELKIGFSLFGSLSKGRPLDGLSREQLEGERGVDIDFNVIYDAGPIGSDEDEKNFLQKHQPKLDEVVEFIKTNPKPGLDGLKASDYPAHFFVNEYIKLCLKKKFGDTKVDEKIYFCDLGHKESWLEIWEIIKMGRVNTIFGLDVGGGMRQYIQKFLTGLSTQKKEVRDNVWSEIATNVLLTERIMVSSKKHGVIGSFAKQVYNAYKLLTDPKIKNAYPKTFEDACKYYRVKIN